MKRLFLVIICIFAASFSLVACKGSKKPTEMRIESYPRQVYLVGCEEQEFLDSLGDGTLFIRYVNGTTSQLFSMNDSSKVEVTGFSSTIVGAKLITVAHKSYENLTVTFTVYIVPASGVSFAITKNPGTMEGQNWVENKYYDDLDVDDVVFNGGEITITNNDDSVDDPIPMTNNVKAFKIELFTDGENVKANVFVMLCGTNLVEKYEVELMETFPVDFKIVTAPKYIFYNSNVTNEDIDIRGLDILVTKNSGKTFNVTNIFANNIDIESIDIENGIVTLKHNEITDPLKQRVHFSIFVVGEGVLASDFSKTELDWETLTPLSQELSEQALATFASISKLTTAEIEAYAILKNHKVDIVNAAFYTLVAEMLSMPTETTEQRQSFIAAYEEFVASNIGGFTNFKSYELYTTEIEGVPTKITIGYILTELSNTYAECKSV